MSRKHVRLKDQNCISEFEFLRQKSQCKFGYLCVKIPSQLDGFDGFQVLCFSWVMYI